jgi:transcriptional regulator with XRE-family HTH domain
MYSCMDVNVGGVRGFQKLVKGAMERQGISLREVARRSSVSPSFLSRILMGERGLPSNELILKIAAALDIQPSERLLIEAGRVPENLKASLAKPLAPALLRATGTLTNEEMQDLMKTITAIKLKHLRRRVSK